MCYNISETYTWLKYMMKLDLNASVLDHEDEGEGVIF
jgi:hypothetical protein